MPYNLTITIGLGEALDRLSILNIKVLKIDDPEKKKVILSERVKLEKSIEDAGWGESTMWTLYTELKSVNQTLWDVEDNIRELDKECFDKPYPNGAVKICNCCERFMKLARSVYYLNDQRYLLKSQIDLMSDGELREVKSYAQSS